MTVYRVRGPDGTIHRFDGPDDATPEEVEAAAAEQFGSGSDPSIPQPGETPGGYVLRKGQRAVSGFVDAVTGRDRMTPEMRDMPEIGKIPMREGRWNQAFGTLLSGNDENRMGVIQKSYGDDVAFRQDEKGNNIATVDGTDYAVNKPGFSGQDLYSTVGQGLLYFGAGRAIKGPATTLPRAAGRQATAAAGTSTAIDLGANQAGAKNDLMDIGMNAGFAGGTAGAAEMMGPAVGAIYRAVRARMPNGQIVNMAGAITPEARKALKAIGVDPDAQSPEFIDLLREYHRNTGDVAVAGRMAESASLPVPVQQTRGQLTANPAQQRAEAAMRAGAYGDDASLTMRGFADEQAAQLRANTEALHGQIAGGSPRVGQRGAGGEMASNRLNQMYDAEKSGVDAAYDAAREANGFISAPAVDTGSQRITAAVLEGHALESVPKVANLVQKFGKLAPDDVTPVRVKELFQWRQQMSGVRANGGEEAAAAGKALKAFDDNIDEALDKALMSGDEEAIGLWREAINKNKEFAQRFKGRDMVGDLVERDHTTNSRRLKIDPSSAANEILGRAQLGAVGRQNIVPDLKKLRAVLGPESPEWHAIREEAFLRFVNKADGAMSGDERMFSGVKFKKAWDDAWRDDTPMMSQLFTQAEKAQIDKFANVSARVTGRVAGGGFQNGADALALLGNDLGRLPFIGDRTKEVTGLFRNLRRAGEARAARQAPTLQIPPGYLGPGAATVQSQSNQKP